MVKPHAPEGMERYRQRFLEELGKEREVVLYHDIDPDGIVSGALLEELLEGMGIKVRSKGVRRYDINFEPGRTYLLADIRIDRPIADAAKEERVKLFYIDHHEPDEIPRSTIHFNPWLMKDVEFPVKPYSYNTALLVWILSNLPEEHDWKVAAAHFTDHAEDEHTRSWMEEMGKRYGRETIERVGNFISLALSYPEEVPYDEMREVVRRAQKPEDIIENEKLRKLWNKYEKELNLWLEKVRELAKKNRIVYTVMEGAENKRLRGAVSTILSDEFPDNVFILGQKEGNYIEYSLRFRKNEDYNIHLGEIAKEAGDRFQGRGGGHPPAAGLRIPVEREKEFREWISKRLRSSLERP